MDIVAIVVMILALLALIGVVVFFLYDYFKHKDENANDFRETGKKIDAEKTDRLSNLKYVVDQVNVVNTDIFNTMTSNVDRLDMNTSNVQKMHTSYVDQVGSYMRFSCNLIPGAPSVSLSNLPGTGAPNLELIQHVTAMMGMTVHDLTGEGKQRVELCNPDKSKCIKIPDEYGNVHVTTLSDGGRVVVDSPLQANNALHLVNTNVADRNLVKLSTDGSSMFLQGNKVALGTNFTAPDAKLHIKSDPYVAPFKITAVDKMGQPSDAVLVSADGSIITTQPILMQSSVNDTTSVARLSVEQDSTTNTKYLQVKTNRLDIQGDLSVSGVAKVNGKVVSTQA